MAEDLLSADDDFVRYHEELGKKVYVKDGAVFLNVFHEYPIELNRCDTPEKLLGWICHLCPKTWVTTDVLRRFILLAAEENSIKIEHGS